MKIELDFNKKEILLFDRSNFLQLYIKLRQIIDNFDEWYIKPTSTYTDKNNFVQIDSWYSSDVLKTIYKSNSNDITGKYSLDIK